jgi:hypothetical protein
MTLTKETADPFCAAFRAIPGCFENKFFYRNALKDLLPDNPEFVNLMTLIFERHFALLRVIPRQDLIPYQALYEEMAKETKFPKDTIISAILLTYLISHVDMATPEEIVGAPKTPDLGAKAGNQGAKKAEEPTPAKNPTPTPEEKAQTPKEKAPTPEKKAPTPEEACGVREAKPVPQKAKNPRKTPVKLIIQLAVILIGVIGLAVLLYFYLN